MSNNLNNGLGGNNNGLSTNSNNWGTNQNDENENENENNIQEMNYTSMSVEDLYIELQKAINSQHVEREEEMNNFSVTRPGVERVNEILTQYLAKGGDINQTDDSNQTLLHFAAFGGKGYIIKLLLEKGADIRIKTNYESTPLFTAISYGSFFKSSEEKQKIFNLTKTMIEYALQKYPTEDCLLAIDESKKNELVQQLRDAVQTNNKKTIPKLQAAIEKEKLVLETKTKDKYNFLSSAYVRTQQMRKLVDNYLNTVEKNRINEKLRPLYHLDIYRGLGKSLPLNLVKKISSFAYGNLPKNKNPQNRIEAKIGRQIEVVHNGKTYFVQGETVFQSAENAAGGYGEIEALENGPLKQIVLQKAKSKNFTYSTNNSKLGTKRQRRNNKNNNNNKQKTTKTTRRTKK